MGVSKWKNLKGWQAGWTNLDSNRQTQVFTTKAESAGYTFTRGYVPCLLRPIASPLNLLAGKQVFKEC